MHILWIPHASWHIPQRAHIFCKALSGAHEIHVTDWVADFTSPRDYFSRRYVENFRYRRYQDGLIQIHGIPRFSPAIFSRPLRRLNTRIFKHYVDRIIENEQIDVVIGTFLLPPPKAPRLVFDLSDENVDNWLHSPHFPDYGNEIENNEQAYLQSADAVVAASSVLVDKARSLGAHGPIYLIPNGIELSQYTDVDSTRVRSSMGIAGCLVGSVGNHDKPEELEILLGAAQILLKNNITFLIAGRGSAVPWARKRAREKHLSNVVFWDYVPPNRLAETISGLDVGLCPYLKTPMDDARSPMRLLAYSAAGLPVVCTDLVEVRRMDFQNVVLVKDNAVALAEGINRALKLERQVPAQIQAYDVPYLAKKFEDVILAKA